MIHTHIDKKVFLIPNATSIVLDLLRLGAALIVLMHHAEDIWSPSSNNLYNFLGKSAHAAVILFFALSGYVIAYTNSRNNRGALQYAQARLSRLCSVVIPALLVTALIEIILRYTDVPVYLHYTRNDSFLRYFITGSFMNEIWFFSAAPRINSPLWSLSFEFWYYVIFGFWFYKGKGVRSFILPVIVCLIAGPKIIVMMPIWLLGYAAYKLPKTKLSYPLLWLGAIVLFLLALLAVTYLPTLPFKPGTPPWIFASQFLSDWILGLLVSVALWFLPLTLVPDSPSSGLKLFRTIADLTFPIYVLHKPLLVLIYSMIEFRMNDAVQQWLATGITLIVACVLGFALEYMRPAWSILFEKILIQVRFAANKLSGQVSK